MFNSLTLRGTRGAVLWGYREAVVLRSWSIAQDKQSKVWKLTGVPERVDAFQARQKGLLFTAPRAEARDGFWAWAVEALDVFPGKIIARLGPPER